MIERRKFFRIKEEDEIIYCILPCYKFKRELAKDLSLGGIRFTASEFIPLHSVCRVEITLKDNLRVVNAIVKIVWAKSVFDDERYDVGAEFVEIGEDDLRILEEYLKEKPKGAQP